MLSTNIRPSLLIFHFVLVLNLCESSVLFDFDIILHSGINFHDITKQFALDSSAASVSSDCAKQLIELIGNHEEALLKMADAWSKFPYSGLLYASRIDYGNYDECISVKVQGKSGTILGKHCTYGLILPDITLSNETEMINNAWKLSYCVPHLCTAEDLKNITNLPLFNEAVCSTQETNSQLDTGAIITIAIFSFIILLMILSTMYDLLYYKKNKEGNFAFTAFSIHANGKTLLTFVKHTNEQVLCFHGIKFISICWIMSGHSALVWTTNPVVDEDKRTKWQHINSSQYIMMAHLAVDSFFFVSGFLMAYLYFKNELSKRSFVVQIKAIPSMVIHRYLRLTPAVTMIFLFVVFLFKYTGDGPLFVNSENLTVPCKNYWWAVFLYIQNYYIFNLVGDLCITTLWYVSADMQLFFFAPLVIIPLAILYRRSFKMTLAALFALNVLFIVVPILIKLMWRDYDPNFTEYDAHSRLTDYFIGVMMGVYMRHEKLKPIKIKNKTNVLLWVTALGAMLGVIMVTQEVNINYGYVSKTVCYSISRPVWCISLCWITYACFNGYGGFINWLLSSKFMQLGGKLTYSLYLVHGPLITQYAYIARNRKVFSDYNLFYDWSGHFILSMLIATFWTLAFELPMITIEKIIFGHRIKNSPKKEINK